MFEDAGSWKPEWVLSQDRSLGDALWRYGLWADGGYDSSCHLLILYLRTYLGSTRQESGHSVVSQCCAVSCLDKAGFC